MISSTSLAPERFVQIRHALDKIEQERDVTVLLAVESGSRAWDFPSRDSDYDIRFIYLQEPPGYLRVHTPCDVAPAGVAPRDVIENRDVQHPDALLDFSGWDIRKYLQLIVRSNPVAFEWLQSPLVYRQDWRFQTLRPLVMPFFSPQAASYHYLSTAKHNFREHMRDGAATTVRQKKFLYICRPLLCMRWIELNPCAGPPPMSFTDLLMEDSTPEEIVAPLVDLVERKRAGEELDEGPTIPALLRFIQGELERWQRDDRAGVKLLSTAAGSVSALDAWFHDLVSTAIRRGPLSTAAA